jgi:hypothetical protein
VRHVMGVEFNAIADALSRNSLQDACLVARREFGLELCLVPACIRE